MNFFITSETSHEVRTLNTVDFENLLHDFFSGKNYGDEINKISTIVICVSADFEALHPVRKSRLSNGKLSLEFKLNYGIYTKLDNIQQERYVANEYFNNLKEILKNKEVKNFDSERFIMDLEVFLFEKELESTN